MWWLCFFHWSHGHSGHKVKKMGRKMIEYGDVLVDTSRNAARCKNVPRSCLWPSSDDGNVYIPYTLTKDFNDDHKKKIKKSLDEIASLTCLKFYYRRKNEPAYISIKSKSGCYAHVGYGKSERTLSLEVPSCVDFGVVTHEFLHAIGFQHEHCRSDRDNYVTIYYGNIEPGKEYNFNLINTNNLGTEYDYTSIMHYGRSAFARRGTYSMLPKPDPNVQMGQYRGLSSTDVYKVNKLYNCDTCGFMLTSKSGSFTSPNFPKNYPNNADCIWIIRLHEKYKILLEFSSFAIQEFAACLGDHVTVYDGANKLSKLLVRPACGTENPTAISTRNELLITFTSIRRLPAPGFNATYRFVECGFMLKNKKGVISRKSSSFTDTHCFWALLTKMKRKFILEIKELHLKETSKCEENYLIIHDTVQNPPQIAGKYCGQESLPININSYGRAVVIEFRQKKSPSEYGFKLSYKSIFNKNPPTFSGSSHESYCNSCAVASGILITFLWKTSL
ncbi:astacin-like metalloendopeptidase isoform X4 [Narcine bancroftii]|uniref:astacin-like metalloendopeptidase isoform X4 n=1 Tax=Narcine bancroftii TaxID=1343680 RepID=UPI003831ED51